MATNESIPIHFSDLFDLREISWDILGESKSTPRHPTGKYYVDNHQDSLRRRIDEYIAGLVRIAVVGKLEHLIANMQSVLIRERDRGQRTVRIGISLQQPKRLFVRDD